MTLTAAHIAAIHYLESRGGRALTDDGHFDASLLKTLYDNDLVMFMADWQKGTRGGPGSNADVVALRYGYRITLRGLLLNAGQQDDSEGR